MKTVITILVLLGTFGLVALLFTPVTGTFVSASYPGIPTATESAYIPPQITPTETSIPFPTYDNSRRPTQPYYEFPTLTSTATTIAPLPPAAHAGDAGYPEPGGYQSPEPRGISVNILNFLAKIIKSIHIGGR